METGSFTNAAGQKIFTRFWPIEGEAKAVVIIVHGLGEHSGRYLHVADALNAAGYICYALDHHGNGQSEGPRFIVGSAKQFVNDLKQFYDIIKAKHPDEKIFILAHSLGSIISLNLILDYPNIIDCIAISGTATNRGEGLPNWQMSLLKQIPYRFPMQFIHLKDSGLDPADPDNIDVLTHNPVFQKKYLEDKLVNRGWTAVSTAKYAILTGKMIQENAANIRLPIMFNYGELDRVVPPSGSKIMYEAVSSTDKLIKSWSNMSHEVMNEIGYEEVLAAIVEWFDKH